MISVHIAACFGRACNRQADDVQDPSGEIGAGVHSSVMQQNIQLQPGCILILSKVVLLVACDGL